MEIRECEYFMGGGKNEDFGGSAQEY